MPTDSDPQGWDGPVRGHPIEVVRSFQQRQAALARAGPEGEAAMGHNSRVGLIVGGPHDGARAAVRPGDPSQTEIVIYIHGTDRLACYARQADGSYLFSRTYDQGEFRRAGPED